MDGQRLRIALTRETTLGTTPPTPRFRTGRIMSETLSYAPQIYTPMEIRSDRMNTDPIKLNEVSAGAMMFEASYPVDNTFLSEVYQSAFLSLWQNTFSRSNSEVANSISAITATNVTFAAGAGTLVPNSLVRITGCSPTLGNNGIYAITAATATSLSAAGLVIEAPPATARIKAVGFGGASADIAATATGLSSTILDFTTLGLQVGQWIKVGATATANRFATAANNDFVRIISIAAHALGLDNLPAGWAPDTGTGKLIRVFFGDLIRNGTTITGLTVERAFLGQAVYNAGAITYIAQRGMAVDKLLHTFTSEAAVTGQADLLGLNGQQTQVALGTSYDAAQTSAMFAANASVGRIAEFGALMALPNPLKSVAFTIQNNLKQLTAVGTVGAVAHRMGEVSVTGTVETYFGSNALLTRLLAATPTSLNLRAQTPDQTGALQGVIWTLPRLVYTGGSSNVSGKSTDLSLPLTFETSIDPLTACEIDCQRLEYFEL